jgi:hypothetical protein
MSLTEARRGAASWQRTIREFYRMNNMTWLDSAWRDLGTARSRRFNPSFGIVAVLSLELGVGANTAIFQLLDAVRLRTLTVKDPGELVELRVADPVGGRTGQFSGRRPQLTNPLWELIRDRQQVFSDAFAWSNVSVNLTTGGEARNAQGLWVTGGFFNGLGAGLGRVPSRTIGEAAAAVLATVLAASRGSARPAGITSTLPPCDIVGGRPRASAWRSGAFTSRSRVRRTFCVGRARRLAKRCWFRECLKPGVTIDRRGRRSRDVDAHLQGDAAGLPRAGRGALPQFARRAILVGPARRRCAARTSLSSGCCSPRPDWSC